VNYENGRFSPQTSVTDSISFPNYENGHFGPQTFASDSNSSLADSQIPFLPFSYPCTPLTAGESELWVTFAPTKQACKNIRACTEVEEVLGREILQMSPVPREELPKNGHWRYSFHFSLFYIALSLCSPLRSCKKLDFKYYRRQLVSRCAAERKEASRGLYIGYSGSGARMKMKQ
jgi:hypothetical protein